MEYQSVLNEELAKCGGNSSVLIISGKGNKIIFEKDASELFPAASVIKIYIALAVLTQVDNKDINLNDQLVLKDSQKLRGSGIVQYFTEGTSLSIYNLLKLMLIISDNTASKMLIEHIGANKVNEITKNKGFADSGIKIENDVFVGWGMTNALNCVEYFQDLYNGKLLLQESTTLLLETLRCTDARLAFARYLPAEISTVVKTGTLPTVRNAVGIVEREKPLFCAILLKDFPELPMTPDHQGLVAIGKMIEAVFQNT